MFTVTSTCGSARTGILRTKTGSYETPFFMPVATKAAAKYLTPSDLEEIGTRTIISNAFILYLRPGLKIIESHGGIHSFMRWDHCSFTDSGGYQARSMQHLADEITDSGITFKSPYDGSLHVLNPKTVMDIEQRIGADVAMAIDHMPLYGESEEDVRKATSRTHRWARQCIFNHTDKTQLLFGICQGGLIPELRRESAKFISSLPFDGIAIGGLAIGEPTEEIGKMLDVSLKEIPEEKPRYLMGVGSPREIIDAVSRGVDMFDSIWPTRLARHSTALTHKGNISLDKGRFLDDMSSIDELCDCKVCATYTRSYLSHLFRTREPLGSQLLCYHNVYFLQKLIENIRDAINTDSWDELLERYKDV